MQTTSSYLYMNGLQTPINTPNIKAEAAIQAAQKALTEPDSSRQRSPNCIPTKFLHNIHVEMYQEEGNCVFCVAFSNDAKYLAVTTADGMAKIYDDEGLYCWKMDRNDKNRWPVTTCAWRPISDALPTKGVLVTGSVSGDLSWWHVPSQREIFHLTEEDNQIYTLSYRPDGTQLATAGKDFAVRIYDEETKALARKFETGVFHHSGHTNRVFASRWKSDDNNVLLTGGWDNSVLIWDMRAKAAARSFFGPHIAGEALDIQDEVILTGSWRAKDPLETWDLGTGKRLTTLADTSLIYTAKYLNGKEGFCVAGGTGWNELRIYNLYDSEHKSEAITVKDGERVGVYTSDVSNEKWPRVAVAGCSNKIRVCALDECTSELRPIKTDPDCW